MIATTAKFDYATLDPGARNIVTQKTMDIRDRWGNSPATLIAPKRRVGGSHLCRVAYFDEAPDEWAVYWFIDPSTWTPFYVGCTGNFLTRMSQHCVSHRSNLDLKKLKVCLDHGSLPVAFIPLASRHEAEHLEYRIITLFARTILNTQLNRWEVRRA